jgi:hypothetical protein
MILLGLAFIAHLAVQKPVQTVVYLGDSVTLKVTTALESTLGSGFIVKALAERVPLPSEKQIQQALDSRPDVVLLGIGTDAATDPNWMTARDKFVPSVEALIGRFRGIESHPKVFLCIPPPASLVATDAKAVLLASQVVPLLKQAARETECPIIDFEAALKDRLDLVDGMLPDQDGAQILADTVSEAIFVGRKADWKVIYTDSEETDEGPAKNAIDGDPDTYWHTNYSTTQEKYPHEIQVDTGMLRTIGGFSYYPRQDGVNGRVAKYEFYVSVDGKNWGEPVATGQFKRNGELAKIYFSKPLQCRYFRFRALSEQQGQMWASAAELDILKFYPKRP